MIGKGHLALPAFLNSPPTALLSLLFYPGPVGLVLLLKHPSLFLPWGLYPECPAPCMDPHHFIGPFAQISPPHKPCSSFALLLLCFP